MRACDVTSVDLSADGKMLTLVSLDLLWPLLMTLWSKHPHSPTVKLNVVIQTDSVNAACTT